MAVPVYQELLEEMTAVIRRGDVAPGQKLGTEVQWADRSGISRMSVRRAVEQLIEAGLVERRQGKGLYVRDQATRTRQVQVVVPDLAFDQCVQIVRGAQACGMERGVGVQVYDAHSKLSWDIDLLRGLPESCPGGAVIVSWHSAHFSQVLYELKLKKYPFVLVDECVRELDVPSVLADNYGGGYAAGKALTELGHRRIGFIGNFKADTVKQRLEGLRDAVNDAQMAFDRSLVLDLDVTPEGDWTGATTDCTRRLLGRGDRPTALFYANDQMAADGCRVIREMGLDIPRQISVVGFDDNPLCQWLDPMLSSVRQPAEAMGRTAMKLLLEAGSSRQTSQIGLHQPQVLTTQWIPRASIAAPGAC